MNLTVIQKQVVRKQHDSFCKTVLRNESRDCHREKKRLDGQQGLAAMLLADVKQENLAVYDAHEDDFSWFKVCGYTVPVESVYVSEAIGSLPKRKRDVILLSYFLDMNDREIAEILHLVPSTVHHHRKAALGLLRDFLEGTPDGCKQGIY